MRLLQPQTGFTIIELMIATAVFSVALVIAATSLIVVGREYDKASIATTTQNANRNIMEDVSRQVQLSPDSPNLRATPQNYGPLTVNAVCVGTTRYSYVIGWQVETVSAPQAATFQTPHALWKDLISDPNSCVAADLTKQDPTTGSVTAAQGIPGTGSESLPLNTRLTDFSVGQDNGATNLWAISVAVAYGDSDLLYDISGTQLTNGGDVTNIKNCAPSTTGGAFCAVSELHTSVYRSLP